MVKGKDKKTETAETPENTEEAPSKKYEEIKDIPGVGPETASKLKKIGITTIELLAMSTPNELKEASVGPETASKIIAEARSTISVPFITASEYAEKQKQVLHLTTGSVELDKLLGGGIESQTITEFFGEFGSGKSQMCHQLSVNVQLPVEKGGLDGSVLYIDTEATFKPRRIEDMAKALGLDPKATLDRIIYAEAFTSDHQVKLLSVADAVIRKHNIKLMIIDSLTSHFRSEYLGREMLANRQQQLNKHMYLLMRFAKAFNIIAVVTNQVMAHPDQFFGDPTKQIGGHIVGHAAHTKIYLRKLKPPNRVARLIASPWLPEGECMIKITPNGIKDVEEEERKEREARRAK